MLLFNYEVRPVITFLNVEGVTESEIHCRLSNVYGTPYPGLKCDLGGQHFTVDEDLQSVVSEFCVKQDAEWDNAGICKLISGYNKSLDA